MVRHAESMLRKTLAALEQTQKKTETEIKAVRLAIAAISGSTPSLLGRRKRKPMTAAERRSVSKRMKAYWAKQRSAKSTRP